MANKNEKHERIREKSVTSRRESGQAIVIIAFILIGLIGTLGLAVDGGGVLFLSRDAQNAADAAILAAIYSKCLDGDPVDSGLRAAAVNGFENGIPGMKVEVVEAPSFISVSPERERQRYVAVVIEAEKPAYFIQVVFDEPLLVNVDAVGYCVRGFLPSSLPAIMGLAGPECGVNQESVSWSGSNVSIYGDIHSNHGLDLNANAGLNDDSSVVGEVTLSGSEVTGGGGTESNGVDYDPGAPEPGDPYVSKENVIEEVFFASDYAPTGAKAALASGPEYGNLYKSIEKIGDDPDFDGTQWWPRDGVLEGLYYVDGDIKITPNSPTHTLDVGPAGVTLVATGTIDINSDDINWRRPFIDYLLLFSEWQASGPDCSVKSINVSASNTHINGLIYAPNGSCELQTSDTAINGAIICYRIDLQGSNLAITYNPNEIKPIDPVIHVAD